MTELVRVTGHRKYGPIWKLLKETGICKVECLTTGATLTIVNAVKKEKTRDKNKPKNKVLRITTTEGETPEKEKCIIIEFRLVPDTSINNL